MSCSRIAVESRGTPEVDESSLAEATILPVAGTTDALGLPLLAPSDDRPAPEDRRLSRRVRLAHGDASLARGLSHKSITSSRRPRLFPRIVIYSSGRRDALSLQAEHLILRQPLTSKHQCWAALQTAWVIVYAQEMAMAKMSARHVGALGDERGRRMGDLAWVAVFQSDGTIVSSRPGLSAPASSASPSELIRACHWRPRFSFERWLATQNRGRVS